MLLPRTFALLALPLITAVRCDPEGRHSCIWRLERDPRPLAGLSPGYFRVCARNWENRKQDCRLQVTAEQLSLWSYPFRYQELEVENTNIPRRILRIPPCTYGSPDPGPP